MQTIDFIHPESAKALDAQKWICSAFEKRTKVMRRYTLLTDISVTDRKAGFVAPRKFVLEVANVGCNVHSLISKTAEN